MIITPEKMYTIKQPRQDEVKAMKEAAPVAKIVNLYFGLETNPNDQDGDENVIELSTEQLEGTWEKNSNAQLIIS